MNENNSEDMRQDSTHISGNSEGEDLEMIQYVADFKKDVEKKFENSKANQTYRLINSKPRSISENRTQVDNDSLNSLEDVHFYDLEALNTKQKILEMKSAKNTSTCSKIVKIIKLLGALDERYLLSQAEKPDSHFFKYLFKLIIDRNVNEVVLKESPRLGSSKSRLTGVSKKSLQNNFGSSNSRDKKNTSAIKVRSRDVNYSSNNNLPTPPIHPPLMKISSNLYFMNKDNSNRSKVICTSPKSMALTNRSTNSKSGKPTVLKGMAKIKPNVTKLKNNNIADIIDSGKRSTDQLIKKTIKKSDSICINGLKKLKHNIGSQNSSERFNQKSQNFQQKTENYFSPMQKDFTKNHISLTKCQLTSLILQNLNKNKRSKEGKSLSKDKNSCISLHPNARLESQSKSFYKGVPRSQKEAPIRIN